MCIGYGTPLPATFLFLFSASKLGLCDTPFNFLHHFTSFIINYSISSTNSKSLMPHSSIFYSSSHNNIRIILPTNNLFCGTSVIESSQVIYLLFIYFLLLLKKNSFQDKCLSLTITSSWIK